MTYKMLILHICQRRNFTVYCYIFLLLVLLCMICNALRFVDVYRHTLNNHVRAVKWQILRDIVTSRKQLKSESRATSYKSDIVSKRLKRL